MSDVGDLGDVGRPPASGDQPPSIGSRQEFAEAIRWSVRASIDAGARRILWVDPDFADWPLDDPALLQSLAGWLRRPMRKLVLLAQGFDGFPRRHPRFVEWRRSWAHAIDPRTPEEVPAALHPCWALDDTRVCVELIDRVHWRGRCTLDVRQSKLMHEQIDAILQRSSAAFPVTQLGI
jgi:hypothetical protein